MRRANLPAVLLLSGILVASCGEEPAGPDPVSSTSPPPSPFRSSGFLNDLDYLTLSATLQEGQSGGTTQTLPPDWPKNCHFGLVVPETSMPAGPIEFTIQVPTREMYQSSQWSEDLESRLVIRLGPNGTQFLGPIMVFGTWMPWENDVLDDDPEVWVHNGNDSTLAAVTYDAVAQRYRIQFNVDHFSDWEACPEPVPAP